MSCDLLPEWLNLILDDVETNLCLPILLIMILCTMQFIVNHILDIGCTVYQNMTTSSCADEETVLKEQNESLMNKIKGCICNWALFSDNTDSKAGECPPSQIVRPNSREDEWDYCEEDCDED